MLRFGRGVKLLHGANPIDDGPGGIAVGADDEGSDALSDLRFRQRIREDALFGMVVNVDEAGSEDKTLGVDDGFSFFGIEFTDADDVIVSDADIGFAQRSARAIGELSVDDEKETGCCCEKSGKSAAKEVSAHNRTNTASLAT